MTDGFGGFSSSWSKIDRACSTGFGACLRRPRRARATPLGQWNRDRPRDPSDRRSGPPVADRPLPLRHPGRARAHGRDHQPRVPAAVPRAGRGLLRLRDDHVPRPGGAQPADVPHDRLRRRRAPAVAAALRRRPGDGRGRRAHGRRRGAGRPRRPQLRLPGPQGHAPRGRGGAALQAAAVRADRARRGRQRRAACPSPSRCGSGSTTSTAPTSRPAGSPRTPGSRPSPCTRGRRRSATRARPTGPRSRGCATRCRRSCRCWATATSSVRRTRSPWSPRPGATAW